MTVETLKAVEIAAWYLNVPIQLAAWWRLDRIWYALRAWLIFDVCRTLTLALLDRNHAGYSTMWMLLCPIGFWLLISAFIDILADANDWLIPGVSGLGIAVGVVAALITGLSASEWQLDPRDTYAVAHIAVSGLLVLIGTIQIVWVDPTRFMWLIWVYCLIDVTGYIALLISPPGQHEVGAFLMVGQTLCLAGFILPHKRKVLI